MVAAGEHPSKPWKGTAQHITEMASWHRRDTGAVNLERYHHSADSTPHGVGCSRRVCDGVQRFFFLPLFGATGTAAACPSSRIWLNNFVLEVKVLAHIVHR